ncbi:MAG: GNAT family N-acetyltransferase [Cyanobacteria bacterium P01_D01_bin.36]
MNCGLIRTLQCEDEHTLWTMLMYAAHESSVSVVKTNLDLIRYVAGWGRVGDFGVVAEQDSAPVGAAWLRLWTEENRGYGYIANDVPELAIAVVPEMRGQGIGTALLSKVLALVKSEFPAVSLSIRADNPALRLYQRMGFVPVTGSEVINREGGLSFTMIYRFTAE